MFLRRLLFKYPQLIRNFSSPNATFTKPFVKELKVPTFCNLFINLPCSVSVKHLDLSVYDSNKLTVKLPNPNNINLRHSLSGVNIFLNGEGLVDSKTVCEIEAPIKANLDITSSSGHITVDYFDSDYVKMKCSTGNITLNKYVGDSVTAITDDGNVKFNDLIQAKKINVHIAESGSISAKRMLGLELCLRTRKGDILVESSYSDKSKFAVDIGNLLLSSIHKDCELNIHETGSLKMTGFNGKLDAFIKSGTVDLQLSQISGDSNLTIENEGKLILRISEECQDDTCFDITSKCIVVAENVKFIKSLVNNVIYLTPLNDIACKNFFINCNKSEVEVQSASWTDMLFAEKSNKR